MGGVQASRLLSDSEGGPDDVWVSSEKGSALKMERQDSSEDRKTGEANE